MRRELICKSVLTWLIYLYYVSLINLVIGISGLYHYWIFNENGEPNEGAAGLNDPIDHGYESDATLPEDDPNWQVGVHGLPSLSGNIDSRLEWIFIYSIL